MAEKFELELLDSLNNQFKLLQLATTKESYDHILTQILDITKAIQTKVEELNAENPFPTGAQKAKDIVLKPGLYKSKNNTYYQILPSDTSNNWYVTEKHFTSDFTSIFTEEDLKLMIELAEMVMVD